MQEIMEQIIKDFKNNKYFQQGISDFKEKKIKQTKVRMFWVKKIISLTDWNKDYKHISSYTFLNKTNDKKIVIGFLVGNQIPGGCEECSEDELFQINEHRKMTNTYPRPIEIEESWKLIN